MNKKIVFSVILGLVATVMSCRDESTYPLPYNDRNIGAYMRVVTLYSNVIDLNNLSGSALDGVFEAVDEEYGELLESFDIVVSFRRGLAVSSEVPVKTVAASEFAPVAEPTYSEYKRARIKIPTADAIAALQTATTNPLVGNPLNGDVFNFRGIVKLKNGKTFTNSNTNINILSGQFYNSTFVYSQVVRSQAGIAAGSWQGSYALTQVSLWSPNHSVALHSTAFPTYLNEKLFPDQNVTLETIADGLSTERKFTVNYRGESVTMRINLEPAPTTASSHPLAANYGNVFIPLQNTGVDCTPERQIYWTWPVGGAFGLSTGLPAGLLPVGLPQANTFNRGYFNTSQNGLTAGQQMFIHVDDDSDEYGRRNGYCTWVRRVSLRLTRL